MFRCLNLLLLFCFIKNSGTPSVGNNLISVKEKKGENFTLTCESEDREITRIVLIRQSKNILFCKKEECESENGRVFKEGSCDVIIKDLRLSDAGKYTLRVYYKNDDQRELEPQILKYHLHIHDEISVKKGEDLKLDVLLINADKVERNSSEGWTELWTRGHGVSSDRNLTINKFTANDTGTYRVLDSKGEILITVTVTESSTGSTGKLETENNHKPNEHTVEPWIIVLSVCGALALALALALAGIIFAVYKIYQCQQRNTAHDYQDVPMQVIAQ